MGLLAKLFGIEPPPTPPDGDGEVSAEAVVAKNADVRSVIDETLDEWQRDLARIGAKSDSRVGPAEALRQARHQVRSQ